MTAPETKWGKFLERDCAGELSCGHCEACRNTPKPLAGLTPLDRTGTEEYFAAVHGEAMRVVAKLGYQPPKPKRGKAPRTKRNDSPSPQCCDYCGAWQAAGVRVFAHEHFPVVACLSCVRSWHGTRVEEAELPPQGCPCGIKWCKARWIATTVE